MKRYIAAIDQGTTGTRCIIFDKAGRVVSSAYEEHRQFYPQPGGVEHNPLEIWEKTKKVIKNALRLKKIDSNEIAGIGVTNQRETTIVWDPHTGNPFCNALVWQDTKTRDLCCQMSEGGLEGLVRDRTGLVINTYFSAPKIRWMLENVPEVKEKAGRGDAVFGNIDTWIIWNLTGGTNGGVHITDYTNASRTMLMNLKTLDWDDELLNAVNIPREMLPEIRPSSDRSIYGYTRKDGPFGAVIPVCGDIGDQQGALFGQTCFEVGEMKNTCGTGCFLLQNTGATPVKSKKGLLTTVAYGLEKGRASYALEGSIAITGAAVQWLRDNLGLIKSAPETEEIARSVEDAGGIYFVPAFSGLFAPYWDMYARGIIIGLTRFITREHIVRATLEAICYQTKDVVNAMYDDSGIKLTALKVDGGASKNNFLMQLQSDILGVTCVRPSVEETSALGSAYCTGLAVGLWSSLDELRENWRMDKKFEPEWDEQKREKGYEGWRKAVERSRNWLSR